MNSLKHLYDFFQKESWGKGILYDPDKDSYCLLGAMHKCKPVEGIDIRAAQRNYALLYNHPDLDQLVKRIKPLLKSDEPIDNVDIVWQFNDTNTYDNVMQLLAMEDV